MGLTESEFWGSTLRKVLALKEYADDQRFKTDYLLAKVSACILNTASHGSAQHLFTAEEIIKPFYPDRVHEPEWDEDMGTYVDPRVTEWLKDSQHQ